MRIKRIRVREYGPLRSFSLEPGDLDIVFGLNEAGKTALVEVLAYVLFKKTSANLRYDKPVDAVIEIEEDGRTYTLPTKRLSIELPVGDVANLMYVQASESTVFGDRGTRFWDGVKSMLSKVDAGIPFTRLDEYIFAAVDLQPVKEEWTRAKQIEIDDERMRKEALGVYLEKIGEMGKKETELSGLVGRNDFVKKQIEEINQYKAFRNYQELVRLHDSYAEAKTTAQEYERYKHDYLNEWQKLDIERRTRLGEGQKVREIETEAKDLERKERVLQDIDRYIIDEGLNTCCAGAAKPAGVPSLVLPVIIVLLAAVAAAFSFANRMLRPPSLILLAGALLLLMFVAYRRRAAERMSVDRKYWLERAKKVFPDIGNIDELPERIGKNQEELIRTKTRIEEKERIIGRMKTARSIDVIDGEISLLRAKTGLAEIADLEVKLSEKRNLENELNKLATRLSGFLQENDPRKWERMINERKTMKPGREPDLSVERDLTAEKTNIQHRIDELTRTIRLFRDVEQARVNVSDDRTAFIEFDALDRKLRDYGLEKEAALKAREILRSMSSELDEFIGGILHGKDSLSEFIGSITNRYHRVLVENENFIIEDNSGRRYALDNLSSGTKDQLLFCFRMAVLSRVYPKGAFMILDDAFIFADWQRRERLARLVRDFVQQGNQVLYLTSDDHTRDLFAGHGARVTSIT